MIIDEIETKSERGLQTVSTQITVNRHANHMWFHWRGAMCPVPGDAILLAAIKPAMKLNHKLVIKSRLSNRIIKDLPKIQKALIQSDPSLSIIDVIAENVEDARPISGAFMQNAGNREKQKPDAGIIFNGGVESFYTLLKHLTEIGSLVFVPDLEIMQKNDGPPQGDILKFLKHPAKELRKELVEMKTNLMSFFRCFGGNRELDRDIVYAVVGVMLSHHLSKLYIPIKHAHFESLQRSDSYPIFDSVLNSDRIYFNCDGAGVSRSAKIEAILANDTIMDTIRVCWENPARGYNCGRCKKCSRTMNRYHIINGLN
jgi:hypothetical protein